MGEKAASLEDTLQSSQANILDEDIVLLNTRSDLTLAFETTGIWSQILLSMIFLRLYDMAKAESSEIGLMSPFTTGTFPGHPYDSNVSILR